MSMLELPPLVTIAEFLRSGESPASVQRSARDGDLFRMRRGVYLPMPAWNALDAASRHRMRIAASQATAHSPLVFSHESAALLSGLPIIGAWPDRAQVTALPERGRRTRYELQWHDAQLAESDIREANGFRVTGPLRTLVDLLASRSFVSGVVTLDHALQNVEQYWVTKQALRAVVADLRPFRNVRKVDAVVNFATGLAESVLESLSLVCFGEWGYPPPQQQREYRGLNGKQYFADFYWKEFDVIGEADGTAKYTDPEFLRGRTVERAVLDEKEREDELRAQCSGFVRWGWSDAWSGTPLVAKLDRAGVRRIG
jgi:hypothetical protein